MKYNKSTQKICERLGALEFQKLVFLVEKIKYKIIKKFFPNTIDNYSDRLDKKMNKELKDVDDEKVKKEIIDKYRFEKLKYKKEINRCENRNYHVNMNYPTEFVKYLEKNKEIHVNGLKGNAFMIIFAIILSILFSNPYPVLLYSFLGFQLLSVIINFECINLQNYNLCRFNDERIKKFLERKEEKNKKSYENNLSEGKNVIAKAFQETDDIPSIDEVIENVSSKEEVEQLLRYLRKELEVKNSKIEIDNDRKLGKSYDR